MTQKPKPQKIFIKKKEKLFDALKMVANRVDTEDDIYYFMPCYFKASGLFNLEVVPLDNPPQDLIDYLNKRREGEQQQQ